MNRFILHACAYPKINGVIFKKARSLNPVAHYLNLHTYHATVYSFTAELSTREWLIQLPNIMFDTVPCLTRILI